MSYLKGVYKRGEGHFFLLFKDSHSYSLRHLAKPEHLWAWGSGPDDRAPGKAMKFLLPEEFTK